MHFHEHWCGIIVRPLGSSDGIASPSGHPRDDIRRISRRVVAGRPLARVRVGRDRCSQVYVQSFPNGEQRMQVSSQGGTEPRWRGDGQELYFLRADRMMMAVPVVAPPNVQSRQNRRRSSRRGCRSWPIPIAGTMTSPPTESAFSSIPRPSPSGRPRSTS